MKIYGRIAICFLIILGLAFSSGCRLFNGDELPGEGPTEPEGPPGITIPIPDPSPIEPDDDPIVYSSGTQLINDNNGDGDPDEDAIRTVYHVTSEFVGNLTNIVSFVQEEPAQENGNWVWIIEEDEDVVEVTAQKNNGGYTWTVTDGQEHVDFEIVISTDNFEGTEGFIEIEEKDEDINIQWTDNTLDIVVMEYYSHENNGGVDEGTLIISISYVLSEEQIDFSIHVEDELGEDSEIVFVIVGHWTPEGDYEISELMVPERHNGPIE